MVGTDSGAGGGGYGDGDGGGGGGGGNGGGGTPVTPVCGPVGSGSLGGEVG